jgi:hypothetical protein
VTKGLLDKHGNDLFLALEKRHDCNLSKEKGSKHFKWDVVLPNIGVHHNLDGKAILRNGSDEYRVALTKLFGFMLDHFEYQVNKQTQHPMLHMFWGTTP